MKSKNICRHSGVISRTDWECLNSHKSAVFWLTGLSGAGKSTIAHGVEKELFNLGMRAKVFDGDNVRHGLCGDLSFSDEARAENTRRIAEVAKLFVENGTICLCAFISPLKADRERVQAIIGPGDYYEVFISCPVDECEQRDVKGYYKMARQGKIKNYTGVSAPYEAPDNPDLTVETAGHSVEDSVQCVVAFIKSKIASDELEKENKKALGADMARVV
ncbi:Adenylyl-sulfate kinase [Pseudodesulfovibrio profundus]|uniref:Adenylyl-sulfate kinase n=1 Tax=Pseudodesulfovibrio profundus TaxID=57320 RepID=A0A2C8FBP0_9BACT|nr:adenylyl-sulfate kinase [Pseudodesulfovibrio profundus]SOB60058.1 Adenylyl-sulfate kinase [Pseudodesulfovibrio profundus]